MLSSIYGNDFTQLTHTSFTIIIPHTSQPASIDVSLPSAYPLTCPPTVGLSIAGVRVSGAEQAEVDVEMQRVWREAAGEVCCYQAVEAVRAIVDLHHTLSIEGRQTERTVATASQSAATDDAAEDKDADERDQPVSHYSDDDQPPPSTNSQPIRQQSRTTAATATTAVPFVSGVTYIDRKSVFIAHTAPIHTTSDLTTLTTNLHTHPKLARATHHITAYRLQAGGYTEEGCEDDGEDRAGGRLLHLLRAMGCVNVWVGVSRWYGGVKLGSDRFRIINNVARQLLEEQGYGERKAAAGDGAGGGNVKKSNISRR